jgi:hypothetical protein
VTISRHNKDSLLNDIQNDDVLFALGHKKDKQLSDEEGDDMPVEKPARKRGPGRVGIT